MSIATAYLMLIPTDSSLVPPPGTARGVAKDLHALAFFISEFDENPPSPPVELVDEEATSFSMYPREPQVPIARFLDGYTPLSIRIEEFRSAVDVTDDTALRYCGHCGTLVETRAICSACGAEEDPGHWRMGPPKVLYQRAFEIGIVAEGGLDLWEKSDREVERGVREFFGETVVNVERRLGMSLRLVRFVGP